MKRFLTLLFSLQLVIFGFSCSEESKIEEPNNNTEENETPEITNGDILIVYFSRTGGNYPNNTHLTVGRTAVMADYIQKYTGGTVFEIIPSVAYPDDYDEMVQLSHHERDTNARPAIKNPLEDLDKYSIVFIGSPIWSYAPPMIMRTFYETYPDLANKIIVPFGTHEGSGIGSCTTLLKEYFPNATILESYGVRGQNVNNARNDVTSWLRKINIQEQI